MNILDIIIDPQTNKHKIKNNIESMIKENPIYNPHTKKQTYKKEILYKI